MMQVMRATGPVVLAALMTVACSRQGGAHQEVLQAPSPTAAATAEDVLVIDESRLDEIRGDYDVSEPLGEATGVAVCESGGATTGCEQAARQQLREAAARRGANLVVVVSSALAQSYPMRLTLRGTLHRATPR